MSPSARAASWAVVAASCVPLAVFAWALHPGIPAGDSAELIAVAATHGVAHPPGYPLYAILGGLWLLLWPHSYAAWALNLFSAVCTSAACGVLAVAVRRAGGSGSSGVLAAGLFAACPPVFSNAIVAEVFGLHALLASAALLALVSAPATGAVVLAYLSTLALSHHHTLVLLTVPASPHTSASGRRAASGSQRSGSNPSRAAPATAAMLRARCARARHACHAQAMHAGTLSSTSV